MLRFDDITDRLKHAGQDLWDEASHRSALARQPQPQGVRPPPLHRLLGELQSLTPKRRTAAALPQRAARQPQPVMLLPGFGSHPIRMRAMERVLARSGHQVQDWGWGVNLGPTIENFDFLCDRVRQMAADHAAPVSLVGWSLGGLFAREIARRETRHVRKVITLGSPFSGDMHANNAWRAYQLITGRAVDEPPFPCAFAAKPPVPTVALWSPRDGIVSPRSAAGWPGERDRAVALRCSHIAFARDPEAIAEVLRQLDWDEG